MVHVIDQKRNILAHININIIRSGKELRRLVNQVCGKDPVDDPLLIIFIKLLKSAGKQTKRCADKHLSCLSAL